MCATLYTSSAAMAVHSAAPETYVVIGSLGKKCACDAQFRNALKAAPEGFSTFDEKNFSGN